MELQTEVHPSRIKIYFMEFLSEIKNLKLEKMISQNNDQCTQFKYALFCQQEQLLTGFWFFLYFFRKFHSLLSDPFVNLLSSFPVTVNLDKITTTTITQFLQWEWLNFPNWLPVCEDLILAHRFREALEIPTTGRRTIL